MAFNVTKARETAKKYIQKGQLQKAIAEYKKIVEHEPNDTTSLQKLGELYVKVGARQEAISTFMKLAELLVNRGFSNRAISIYKQILQLNPLLVPVYLKLSEIFKSLGLSKDARIFNQRAFEIVQKTGSVQEVYKLLKKIIEMDPQDAISRIALAETALKMKRTDEAIEQFESALPILRKQHLDDLFIRAAERLLYHKPSHIPLCRELAILHMKRGEVSRAMKLLLHCRKHDPEDIETLELLIAHFLKEKNYEKAVVVLLEKGKILHKRGSVEEAEQVFKKVLEINPNNAEANEFLQQIQKQQPHLQLVEPQSAEPLPTREAAPVQLPAEIQQIEKKYDYEVKLFLKYGLKDKALEHLVKGIEQVPDSIILREKLKDLYIDMGEIEYGIQQLYILAEMLHPVEPERAKYYLKEILLLNSEEEKAQKMLQAYKPDASPPPSAQTPQEVIPPETPSYGQYQPSHPSSVETLSNFLEEETSDVINSAQPKDIGAVLEEPFADIDFPPVRSPSSEITSEELKALETETSKDFDLNEIQPSSQGQSAQAHPPEIEQILDEVDFFLEQGLAGEAKMFLKDSLKNYPQNPLLLNKLNEIEGRGSATGQIHQRADATTLPQDQQISPDDEEVEGLSAIDSIIAKSQPANHQAGGMKMVEVATPSQIAPEDARTHHDLGIAYMEMGLWDSAISEFRIASQNPSMEATCYNLIGNCLVNAGKIEEAINEYKTGLFAKEKTKEQALTLYYNIAEAYIKLKDYKEALYYLQNVKNMAPSFRDVTRKIEEIKENYTAFLKEKESEKLKEKEKEKEPEEKTTEPANDIDAAFDDLFGDFSPDKSGKK